MAKLSKTQEKVLKELIDDCKKAREWVRNITTLQAYVEWKENRPYMNKGYKIDYLKNHTYEEYLEHYKSDYEYYMKYYTDASNGYIFCMDVNKRTLAKLQKCGYIESFENKWKTDEMVQLNLEAVGLNEEW